MNATDAYPRLIHALNDLRRQWRAQMVLQGVLLALAGVAAVLLTVIATDNLFQLDTAGRSLLALLLWGALAVCLLRLVVKRWLEDRRDDYFAALVEQKHPELRNQLINALQLGRHNQNGFSPVLIDAIVTDAARATADLDMNTSLDRRPTKRATLVAALAILVIGGYAVTLTPRFTNGFARVLLPFADIPPYTATQVAVKHENDRVPEGDPVIVEAKVTGAFIPETAQVFRRVGNGPWQSSGMLPKQTDDATSRTFHFTLQQASESFEYYVASGDGRSKKYRVEVVKRPQIESVSLTYAPPAYTALPPRKVTESDGEIAGIAGTTVSVKLKATKPLAEAKFLIQGGEVLNLEKGANDRSWLGSFIIWCKDAKQNPEVTGRLLQAPARYQIKLLDTDGYENGDPLMRSIALAKDQAPSVAITAPGRDLQVKPDAVIPITIETRDDYGIDELRLLYRVNDEQTVRELARFPHDGPPKLQSSTPFKWNLNSRGLKGGDLVQYWAVATDRNRITGPGQSESRRFAVFLLSPEQVAAKLDLRIDDYVQALEKLVLLQRQNRAQTVSGIAFEPLVTRQALIRAETARLARTMEKDALPVATIVQALDDLFAGLMADALKLLETGKDSTNPAQATQRRTESLPVQDKIIARLEALLARLQRNEQAKEALRKIEKKDQAAHKEITRTLAQMIKDLDKMLQEKTELMAKFERLPKKPTDEYKEEVAKATKELDDFKKRWEKWAKGTVNELTKMPTGFTDDFGLRKDINKIYEEIEKQETRAKADKVEVSLEDLGAGLATRMKEDLETWMPDAPDATKWVLEEPLNKKNMEIPEMPLPKGVEDLIGELLQKADEFDEEADDVTSAWGDNLDQAGWGVSDGPMSLFSAKGKTGNDQPNNNELTGRSGDGRRGKSTGQMTGDTARGLEGRKTPARVGNERYEPGQLKQEGSEDPNGATGGGKKAGAGRKGLQGGTPPDFSKNMERLSAKQAGIREKAEQIAQKLDSVGITSKRLTESIELMKSVEKDLRDLNYEDAARKRKVALNKLRGSFTELDQSTVAQLSRARDLPPQLRSELLQAADESYPAGYESMLKNYFKALSSAEK